MKNIETIKVFLLPIILLLSFQSVAQDSCTYRLRLVDTEGDGWDDSQLYIKLGNTPERAYTHNGILAKASDSVRLYDFKVKIGDTMVVRYDPQGVYQDEIYFTLFNNANEPILARGPSPASGQVYKNAIKCVTCGSPIEAKVASVRTFTATINWKPAVVGSRPTYRVVWDTLNFTPGTITPSRSSIETTDTFAVLQGLKEIKRYYAYVRSTCVPITDTSGWVGPLSFLTDTATNVGISAITEPLSKCDLSIATVKVNIKNYGGAPVSLIPLKYSVNGIVAPVSQPADGYYTGVISMDSTAEFPFKAMWDFSQPGEYRIAAWTELKEDKNVKNDTFRTILTRPRYITQLPYQQNFESGKDTWSVQDAIGNSTWTLGTPRYQGGRFINGAASGSQAWTTAPDTSYRNNDTSYLLSPCFDFTSQSVDPNISFAINFYSERNFDGAWLEASTDAGDTWTRIGSRSTGVNWYNDTLSRTNQEVWTGVNRLGWKVAQHPLIGTKGKSQVRLRFAFRSDGAFNQNFDGVAIDNIAITTANTIDLAIDSISRKDISDCGNVKDSIQIRIYNLSNTNQNTYSVGYRLDNNTAITENVTLNIQPGSSILYKFTTPLNTFVSQGVHRISAWVSQANDAARVNDTAYTTFTVAPPVRGAFTFNFNDGLFPQNWQRLRGAARIGGLNNPTTNGFLFANIYTDTAIVGRDSIITPNAQVFDVTTNKLGIIRDMDSLRYDYRFISEIFTGYDLVTKDTLKVMVSEECSNNWVVMDTIFKSKHTVTSGYRTRSFSLKPFLGKTVKIRFLHTSAIDSFDGYFIQLDNIQYISNCPTDFGLKVTIKNTTAGINNGEIALVPSRGIAPYVYKWSNDSTRSTITRLIPGNYTVSVSDANGCLDVATFTVNTISSTREASSVITKVVLAPNPTNNTAILDVKFTKILDAKVQVMNIMGQILTEQTTKQADQAQYPIDLSDRPAGMYLIRIIADNKIFVTRLVKQ